MHHANVDIVTVWVQLEYLRLSRLLKSSSSVMVCVFVFTRFHSEIEEGENGEESISELIVYTGSCSVIKHNQAPFLLLSKM